MRRGDVHLSYCSNIHPAETWAETDAVLRGPVAEVAARLSPDAPFGIGLRLSARAASELRRTGAPAVRDALTDAGQYVFSLNGFPFGRFHGRPVKAEVYRPDWREPARLEYTRDLVAVLADLLPPDTAGSISTVPGCFRAEADAAGVERIAGALADAVADLARLRRERGIDIALALEPEPACLLETTAEGIAFLQAHLLNDAALDELAQAIGHTRAAAEQAVRHHLGLCLDTCHAAVEFEDPLEAVASVAAAGLRIPKVQATTGLRIRPVDPAAVAAVAAFADEVYLHQVVARTGAQLERFDDLPPAIAAFEAGARFDEWRVHFHVPVFLARPEPFENTQSFVAACLPAAIEAGCRHVEVETYTWDVLPPAHRTDDVVDAIVREVQWTEAQLR